MAVRRDTTRAQKEKTQDQDIVPSLERHIAAGGSTYRAVERPVVIRRQSP